MVKDQIIVVGAGFVGLSTAWYLSKSGKKVIVLEKRPHPGGMAGGFKSKGWTWFLDKHYHHIFSSDKDFDQFVRDARLKSKLFFQRPKNSFFIKDKIVPIIPSIRETRMLISLGHLKLRKDWREIENIKAIPWLKKKMGTEAFSRYWEPLFKGKFGRYANRISLAWFWSRIKKRTFRLGYYWGGFQALANSLVKKLKANGVEFYFHNEVKKIGRSRKGFVAITNKKRFTGSEMIVTTPLPIALRLLWFLPEKLRKKHGKIDFLDATTLVLVLDQALLKDTYWLNISDDSFPFVALVEHTNFINPKRYKGKKIVYLAKYHTEKSPIASMEKPELLRLYTPFIRKINPDFKRSWVKKSWMFREKYAQPVVETNYSKLKPDIQTPVKGLFWANSAHIYPWDRGLNYAVDLGKKTADLMLKD